jgi:hypothetical protein
MSYSSFVRIHNHDQNCGSIVLDDVPLVAGKRKTGLMPFRSSVAQAARSLRAERRGCGQPVKAQASRLNLRTNCPQAIDGPVLPIRLGKRV